MAGQGLADRLPGGGLPQPHRAVATGADKKLAVGAEGDRSEGRGRPLPYKTCTDDQGAHHASNQQAPREGHVLLPLPPAGGAESHRDVAEREPRRTEQAPAGRKKAGLVFDLLDIFKVSAPLLSSLSSWPTHEASRPDQQACECRRPDRVFLLQNEVEGPLSSQRQDRQQGQGQRAHQLVSMPGTQTGGRPTSR